MKFDTIAVTGGFHHDEQTGSTNIPIHMSNAFQFKSADSAANLFDLTEAGYIYTRMHNPTTTVFEERVAALEGGTGAVAAASGQAAELMLFATLCNAGDEILASTRLYGGTMNLLSSTLKRFGINVKLADQRNPESWDSLITDKTKAVYAESIANPDGSIPDFEAIAAVAHKHKIPFIIDNTMATPYLFRPVEVGANVVLHSSTKYIGGNGTAMGGVVVDLGNFDWAASGRFPEFTEPDSSYHGVKFAEAFGSAALAVKMRVQILRDFGGVISPFNSFLMVTGLQTLSVRMKQHVENARKVAAFLENHPNVARVIYPELENHPDNAQAKRYFKKGAGAMVSFEVKGGYEQAKRVIESIKLCVHATNVGDARTVLTHPASTTHRQLSEEKLKAAGISKTFLRLSVGIEDVEDIIDDIAQALA
ncbi:MAG: O-acetylhomoserine aminocarboxypropyltransferase/cysteine synthase [Deferribacteraceae bacterium]|jgi:O-acetylhomoserine (thiol)-lyase|nr:O-acetylhomoserine aminocarboxypropyltransferase/cysteine synthase [Deferribacteraceae bacterium]